MIFDLGGVIIDLDFDASYQAFSRLSGLSTEEIAHRTDGMMFFKEYEKGLISSQAFRDQIQGLLEFSAPSEEIDNAWCAMLGVIPEYRLQMLNKLKHRYRTFALSNTNEIHVRKFNNIIENTIGDTHLFHHHFEEVYYSHQLKKRKPDLEIYQEVLDRQSLQAEQTLFIDDNHENILGAEKLNIQTFHLKEPAQLTSLFDAT